jgi:Ni/Co efflux regulator RcnB
MRKVLYLLGSAMVLAPAGAPALAQSAPQQQQQKQQQDQNKFDPNEVVCEKQMVTGSRLGSKRVCMTRSQWADQRRSDRQDIDRGQTQRSIEVPH